MAAPEQYAALKVLLGNGVNVGPVWSCGRKTRYADLKSAVAEASRVTPKKRTYRMRVYVCEFCHGFHLATGDATPTKATAPAKAKKPTKSEGECLREQRDAALKEVMKLRALKCACWWCRLRRWWAGTRTTLTPQQSVTK